MEVGVTREATVALFSYIINDLLSINTVMLFCIGERLCLGIQSSLIISNNFDDRLDTSERLKQHLRRCAMKLVQSHPLLR